MTWPRYGAERLYWRNQMVSPDRAQQANEYMKEKMLFTPRMFQIINTVAPEAG